MGLGLRSCSGLPTSGGTSANGDSGVGEWWDCNVLWPAKSFVRNSAVDS